MDDKKLAAYTKIIDKCGNSENNLIAILMEVQKLSDNSCLLQDDIALIASSLNIPVIKVYEVATFYSMISMIPMGKHVFEVCRSAPCQIKQVTTLVKLLEEMLNIKIGQTTDDGQITLQYINCIGACDTGPVLKIEDRIYSSPTVEKLKEIIEKCRGDVNVQ